jgi:cyclophilin family peptidyl-prolyl cis-trans isomerase
MSLAIHQLVIPIEMNRPRPAKRRALILTLQVSANRTKFLTYSQSQIACANMITHLHTNNSDFRPKPVAMIALLILACLAFAGCGSDEKSDSKASSQDSGASVDGGGSDDSSNGEEATKSDSGSDAKQWDAPPKMTIDPKKKYTALVKTNKGSFTITLDPKKAPNAVNNFVFLAREGFYRNVPFHRIVKGFVIQTGDPTGTGTGGPGYNIKDDPGGKYTRGTVAMANTGAPNSAGSQFFVSLDELQLPATYALFGNVTDGMDVVDKIAETPVETADSGEASSPTEKVTLQDVTITES